MQLEDIWGRGGGVFIACSNCKAPGCSNLPAKRLGVKEAGEVTLQFLRQRFQRHLEHAKGLEQRVELGKMLA